ncbi:hypothetical protein SGL43_07434, partial [Streptomyces globisporus]
DPGPRGLTTDRQRRGRNTGAPLSSPPPCTSSALSEPAPPPSRYRRRRHRLRPGRSRLRRRLRPPSDRPRLHRPHPHPHRHRDHPHAPTKSAPATPQDLENSDRDRVASPHLGVGVTGGVQRNEPNTACTTTTSPCPWAQSTGDRYRRPLPQLLVLSYVGGSRPVRLLGSAGQGDDYLLLRGRASERVNRPPIPACPAAGSRTLRRGTAGAAATVGVLGGGRGEWWWDQPTASHRYRCGTGRAIGSTARWLVRRAR